MLIIWLCPIGAPCLPFPGGNLLLDNAPDGKRLCLCLHTWMSRLMCFRYLVASFNEPFL